MVLEYFVNIETYGGGIICRQCSICESLNLEFLRKVLHLFE